MLQVLLHYSMELGYKSMEIRKLQGLCEKTENPRVGGSIPPQATSKPFGNTRGFWFSKVFK